MLICNTLSSNSPSPFDLSHFFDRDMGVSIRRYRPPIVKVVTELTVTASQKIGFQVNPGQAIVTTTTSTASNLRLWNHRSLWHVIDDANASRNSGADYRASYIDAVIVVYLNMVVVFDA